MIQQLKSWKRKWFPSRSQKAFIEQEKHAFQSRKAFYGAFLQPGDLCFDVGANMGNRIRPLLAAGAKVVAVEPQESCIRHLTQTFKNQITLVTKGLGAQQGSAEFHISSSHTLSSFSSEWIESVKEDRFKEQNWDKTVQVEITTLDHLIAQYGKPVFVKIDVEGYEAEVLRGLSHPIPMISYEYTVPEQTTGILECLDLILRNSSGIQCNYSIGESMEWALENWLSADEMKAHVATNEFIRTGFGDMYIRQASVV